MMHEKARARPANDVVHNVAVSPDRRLRWNERDPDDNLAVNAVQPSIGQAAAGRSWNFASVPAFLPDRPNRQRAPSPITALPSPVAVQRKLAIGRVDDPLEREADAVADRVLRMPDPEVSVATAPPQVSRKCAACEEEKELQKKTASPETAAIEAPGIVHEVLGSPGQPLDLPTRAFFEPRFGNDFSRVRVHSDVRATESARAVGALAYTVGEQIVLGNGQVGQCELLAHELVHVMQAGRAQPQSKLQAKIGDATNAEEHHTDKAAQRPIAGAAPVVLRSTEAWKLRRLLGVGCCSMRGPMNTDIIGVFEHELIEGDYERRNPSAERECSIPESTPKGNRGYADIVDPPIRQVFEIKPDNPAGIRDAVNEAELYVMGADEFCGGNWKLGTSYFEHPIHDVGERQLWARLAEPGAIVYQWREKKHKKEVEWTRLLLLAAALAAAAAAKAWKAGEKDVGGPVTAFIAIFAAAAVLVLGERKAKAGTQRTDDDPLVALAEVLTDTGQPMPPEIQKLLDENPELRELVRHEIERRRRSGSRTSPEAKPGSAGGSGTTTTPGAAPNTTGGPTAGGTGLTTTPGTTPDTTGGPTAGAGGSSKASLEPKPITPKATAPAPGAADRSKQAQKSDAGANASYWQSAEKAMNSFNWAQLSGTNNIFCIFPEKHALIKPKQELIMFNFVCRGEKKYVFGETVIVEARNGLSTTVRVKEVYGALSSDGEHLPPPEKPGTIRTFEDAP